MYSIDIYYYVYMAFYIKCYVDYIYTMYTFQLSVLSIAIQFFKLMSNGSHKNT